MSCPLEIWVYDTLGQCLSSSGVAGQPRARGALMADGACRSTEILETTDTGSSFLLPGIYTAECSPDAAGFGTVEMWNSGCLDATCSRTTGNSPVGTCDRDLTSIGSLFSRASPPGVHVVQNPTLRQTGFFTCYGLTGGAGFGLTVGFAIFGDCNCETALPTAPPSPTPTTRPTLRPSPLPTSQPTELPTSGPTLVPTTQPPSPSPSLRLVTVAPQAPATVPSPFTSQPPTRVDPTESLSPSLATTTTTASPTTTTASPTTTTASPTTTTASTTTTTASPTSAPMTATSGQNPSAASTPDSNNSSSSLIMVAGGAGGAVLLVVVVGWLVLAAIRRQKKESPPPGSPERTSTTPNSSVYTKSNPQPAAANADGFMEVAFTAPDDVSTLGEPFGTTDPDYIQQDESTASVALSYLRGEAFLTDDCEGASRTGASRSASSATTDIDPDRLLPKDDESFDQLYQNASSMPASGMDVLRYDVHVPPGRIGMLLDAEVPRVNAIKVDSIFATRNVQVGDFLVSLDEVDVRGMAPMDVSRMIVLKSKQPRRVFTFERR